MSYTALYRKYRPSNFSNVVGQKIVVNILKNSLMTGHISHAYLFAGPRGTGKTSIAKIFAKAVNCLDFHDDICGKCENCINLEKNDIDIIEIDAASNNGVEEIRTIRENVKLLPSFCKYKVYIIDEVHMLSTGAFNALLKTLEEPPTHVIFILATTEINKIPLTILSRCQRFDFTRLSEEDIEERLKFILNTENRKLSDSVISYISEISDGGLRDAINLLDQVLSLDNDQVTVDEINDLSGNISSDTVYKLFENILNVDFKNTLSILDKISKKGKNFNDLVDKMLILIRDIAINMDVKDYFDSSYSKILGQFEITKKNLLTLTNLLNELSFQLKHSNDQKLLFEIYILSFLNTIEVIDNNVNSNINSSEIASVNNTTFSTKQHNLVEEKSIAKSNSNGVSSNKDDVFQIKDVRINNVLAEADKNVLNNLILNFSEINNYISNKKYNSVAVLLLDSKIVCASNKYLLFTFADKSTLDIFYQNLKLLELLIMEVFKYPYKLVAVSNDEWKNIKQEYINKKKNGEKYIFIEENDVKLNMKDKNDDVEDLALDIFGEDAVSIK